MTEEEYLKSKQKELDKYISVTEDFFNLSERLQDTIITNPLFDYESVWDRLGFEQKILVISSNTNFKYKNLWEKLSVVEKDNVIQYTHNFLYKKYIPKPTDSELNLLIRRGDFDVTNYFDKLSYEQKLTICSIRSFDYVKFWDRLNSYHKLEIINHNVNFDPEPYFDELQEEAESYVESNDSLLDKYCKRKFGLNYNNIWDKINDQQKMNIAINNIDFVVGDKKDEMFKLFKKYPFKLDDFILRKIITLDFQTKKIDFEELDVSVKELALDLFKSFKTMNYNKFVEGDVPDDFDKFVPCCIAKVTEDIKINNPPIIIILNGKINPDIIKKGYYMYSLQNSEMVPIKKYKYILRESKFERIFKQ